MKHKSDSTVRRSFALLRRMDSRFFPYITANGILQTLAGYLPVLVMAQVINRIVIQRDFKTVMLFALAGALVTMIVNVLRSWMEKTVNVMSQNISYSFETLIARTTMTMEYSQMDSEKTRQMQSRIKTDRSWGSGFFGVTAKVQQIVQQITGIVVSVIILVPLLVRSIADKNGYLFGTILIMLILSVASALFFDRYYSKRESDEMGRMTQTESRSRFQSMTEGSQAISYRGIKDILIYGASSLIEPSVKEENEKVHEHALRLSGINFAGGMIKGGSNSLLIGLSYLMAAFCAYVGQIAIGYVVQYAQALFQLSTGLSSLLQTRAELQVDMDRLASTLDYIEIETPKTREGMVKPKSMKEIEFRNVSFTYPGTDQPAIDGLNVKIDARHKTAIVGLNGSGKTTLIKLLCRLYRPDHGSILLDGVDIWDFDEDTYRNLLAVVFQDFSLFSFLLGSVVASSDTFDPERAEDALNRAGMGEWMKSLENGLDTVLYREYEKDGVDISGGEAQKIAIARAIYKDASLVILDEPTAALDPQAEFDVYTRLAELIGSRGVIYISHRLTSCKFCDTIIVMDNGQAIEQSTHEQLLKSDGRYSQMWNAQAQYYVTT